MPITLYALSKLVLIITIPRPQFYPDFTKKRLSIVSGHSAQFIFEQRFPQHNMYVYVVKGILKIESVK